MTNRANIKIAVVGIGYVGLSNSLILAQNNEVLALDISQEKVNKINNSISPLEEEDISNFFKEKKLNLIATTDPYLAINGAKFVIISTPTDYDELTNSFNTESIEKVIKSVIDINKDAIVIIKSTVPIGYTKKIKEQFNNKNIIFSPEFLREGSALKDNLYPSRIIIGEKSTRAKEFADLLIQGARKDNIPTLYMNSDEAEAVKLFSNTFLAMRVAFFNELDTFANIKDLNTKSIIDGMSHDSRIGSYYNNPSFGYGGYCLPKDTKQMAANFEGIPNKIISAIVESNYIRKNFIAELALKVKPNTIGIYRLIMKSGADNIRASAIQDIIQIIKKNNTNVIIYEPLIQASTFFDCVVTNSLEDFKASSDIILSNRNNDELSDVAHKLITRDLIGRD